MGALCSCFSSEAAEEMVINKKKSIETIDQGPKGSMKLDYQGNDYEEFATFGAGCYWGTEKYFIKNF